MAKKHDSRGFFIRWAYCLRCGHVYLNNAISRKESKKDCPGSDED